MPSFAISPLTVTTNVGSAVQFMVPSAGVGATYQWTKAGQPLPGETNRSLTLTNLQRAHSGTYAVVVGVAGASTNLGAAELRVRSPMRVIEMSRRPGNGLRLVISDDTVPGLSPDDASAFEVWVSDRVGVAESWVRLTNGISVVSGRLPVDEAGDARPQRFYRVIQR